MSFLGENTSQRRQAKSSHHAWELSFSEGRFKAGPHGGWWHAEPFLTNESKPGRFSEVEGQKKLPLPAIIAATVIAVGIAAFAAYKSFGPQPVAAVTEAEKTNSDVIIDIVKKTNGDWSKVSKEDQATLYKIAGGYAAQAYQKKKQEIGMK
jgi:hypothetical protein